MSFWRSLLYLALPLFLLDLGTKEWIVRRFPPPHDVFVASEPVIDGFFDLVRVHNTGVAWGMGNGEQWANWVFGGVGVAALFFVSWLWRKNAFPTRVSQVAAVLLVSGVIGNLVDRLLRGYVVDFLHFNLGFMQWPAFNVADSCICVAAGLLFISAFQKTPEDASQKVRESPGAD